MLDAWITKQKLRPGSNWGETGGQNVRFVHYPPVAKGEGLVLLWLADEAAAAQPVDPLSSLPASEYLGKIDRWHVYYLASDKALAAWPTAKEDIKKALAGDPELSLKIELERTEHVAGTDVSAFLSISNLGPADIEAPATYWSAKIVVDGTAYERLPKFIGTWNGPGTIIPKGVYKGGLRLSQYGVTPESLTPGDHTISVKIGGEQSNEVTFKVLPQAAEEKKEGGAGATNPRDLIRVVRADSTIECDLEGKCLPVEHKVRRGLVSPDGKHVVYDVTEDGANCLMIAPTNDGNKARRLTDQKGYQGSPSWFPDSARIAYESIQSGKTQICAVDLFRPASGDTKYEQVTSHKHGARRPKFGPDGSLGYIVWREPMGKEALSDLVVMRGGKPTTIVSKKSIDDYVWSPDGKTIAISIRGELVFYDMKAERAQSIALREIDPELGSHLPRLVTWNPAGDAVACRIEALGGRIVGGPTLPGDNELFIVPRAGKPKSFSIGKTRTESPRPAGAPNSSLLVLDLEWVRR
jgi:hypothetical protein